MRTCLQKRSKTYSNGSYYYVTRLRPITLSHKDNDN